MALQWETGRALQARMALALVLVVVLPVAFVYAFVFLMNTVGVELLAFATERAGSEPVALAVGSDGVYLADDEGLTALAHDGSVRWRRGVGGPAGPPGLSETGVYHATVDGTVRSFSPTGRERWAHDPRGRVRSRVAAAGDRAYAIAGEELVGLGPEGTVWRVPLGREEPFTPDFGPFVVGRTLVVGGSGEVRGYWRSQLRR